MRAVALSLLLVPACTVYVSRAEQSYSDGRYLETAEDLAAREPDVARLPVDHQARYGVYRGMALLQLGDVEGARRWLGYAREVDARQPTLDPQRRQLLDRGWAEVSRVQPPNVSANGGARGPAAPDR